MKKSSYIIQLVLLLSFMTEFKTVQAQWHKWQFGGGVGSLTYHGDLSDKFVNANLQELGYHAFVERLIAKKTGIYWRLESVNGHLLGSDRAPGGWLNGTSENFDRSLNFRTNIHDVNTSFVFYFGNKNKRDRAPFLNAYIRAGIGVGFFEVYGDLKDANGNIYNYWSDQTIRDIAQNAPNAIDANVISRDNDYETNLTDLGIEKSYNRFKWQIPVGLGLKMRLGDAVSLLLDAQYTYAMTDYLDNVGDSRTQASITDPAVLYAADPAGFIGDRPRNLDKPVGMNDGYLYVSAGLSFNVGNNVKPKFKSPVYYPKTISPVQKDTLTDEKEQSVHPLDSMANLIGQTVGSDSVKTVLSDSISSVDTDSVLQQIIQQNYRIWLAQDTSMNQKQIDSIALIKLYQPDSYIVQYFGQSDSAGNINVLKTDTIQFDSLNSVVVKNAVSYSTEPIKLKISKDTIITKAPVSQLKDSTLNYQDSLSYAIQQLRLQLDNLERQISKDSNNAGPVKAKSVSDTATYRLNAKQDSLKTGMKTDSTNSSPSNYAIQSGSNAKRDIKADSLSLKDSVLNQQSNRVTGQTGFSKMDTLNNVDTTRKNQLDSLQRNQEEQDKIQRQIDSLQKQLKSPKDTVSNNILNAPRTSADTIKTDSVAILKQRIAELENSSATKLKAVGDTVKKGTDSLKVKTTSSVDSTKNNRLEELKKKIVADDSIAKKKDNVNKTATENEDRLKSKADSVKVEKDSLIKKASNTPDSSSNQTIDDLKRRIKELEKAPQEKADSLKSESRSTPAKGNSSVNNKDSLANVTTNARMASDTTEKVSDEEKKLKNRIAELENTSATKLKAVEDTVKMRTDSLKVKTTAAVDSTKNNRLEEQKKKTVAEDSIAKKKDDVNKTARASEDRLKSKADSVKVEKDALAKKASNTADTSYNQTIDDLKRRIKELEKAPQEKADSLKSESRSTPKKVNTPVDNKDSLTNVTTNARMASNAAEKVSNEDQELKNRIAELEKQIVQQQKTKDSIVQASNNNSSKNAKTAATPTDKQQEELQKRMNELEEQLKVNQNAATSSSLSNQEKIIYQSRIDSLNRALEYQRMYSGNYQYPNQQSRSSMPVIEPVISVPINTGNGRERRQERKANKAAADGASLTAETSEDNADVTVNNTKDKGPGFFEAKRLKKEALAEESESEAVADSSTTDSLSAADSLSLGVNQNAKIADAEADSTLRAENERMKTQIDDIQKNQDSLLVILSNLLSKVNEPTPAPAPVVIEKEVVQPEDTGKIIEGILAQPSTKVFFAVGKSALGNQYKTGLDQLANQLKNYPELKMELKGFADPTGNAAANMLLSEKRAQSVKTYLLQVHNIGTDRVTVLPVGQENNSSDLSYSRRVEVKLVK